MIDFKLPPGEFTIAPEVVERMGGAKALDAFVAQVRAAEAAGRSSEALAEALRLHIKAMQDLGLDGLMPPLFDKD